MTITPPKSVIANVTTLPTSQDALNAMFEEIAPNGEIEIWSQYDAHEAAKVLGQLLGEPKMMAEVDGV
ncbi:MAG: hypothetical protein ACKVY0_06140 [Prosthecobacter sp.]|uniref:hypothetical protein n=1 Tax=Prosthecobacter sp. TaxID=1965333 RepID=UPI0038FF2B37